MKGKRESSQKESRPPAVDGARSLLADLLVALWFVVAGIAFWGPYCHLAIGPLAMPVYCVVLLVVAARSTLVMVRHLEARPK